MKKTLLILTILTLGACSQKKEFSLLGKWKPVVKFGFNGSKIYQKEIENGNIINFEKGNVATDGQGNKGTYEVNGDSLHISLPQNEKFYLLYHNKHTYDEMTLTPVTPEYKNDVSAEVCKFVYKKI